MFQQVQNLKVFIGEIYFITNKNMSAQYPSAIETPRTIANRNGVVYDENDTKTLFAEDLQKIHLELIAIQTALGINLENIIYKTAGGQAKIPLASRARAYRNTTTQALSDNTWTKVQLNAENFDNLGEFNSSSTYRFIAAEAGYYQVNGDVHFSDSVANALVECAIYKNGAVVAIGSGRTATASGWMSVHANISDVVYLAAGDYVELYAWTYGGANHINMGSQMTFLSVHRLS